MGGVFGGDINCRRTVAGADNADGNGIQFGETENQRKPNGQENAKLPGSPEEKYFGILKKGAKIGHCTDSDKDQKRKQFISDAHVVNRSQKPLVSH